MGSSLTLGSLVGSVYKGFILPSLFWDSSLDPHLDSYRCPDFLKDLLSAAAGNLTRILNPRFWQIGFECRVSNLQHPCPRHRCLQHVPQSPTEPKYLPGCHPQKQEPCDLNHEPLARKPSEPSSPSLSCYILTPLTP